MNVEKLLTLVDLLLGTVILCSVSAEKEVFMKKMECLNYMPELVRNVSCNLTHTSHRSGLINAEFILNKDVEYLKGIFILTLKAGSHGTNFTTLDLDYCQMLSSVEKNFILKMVTTQLRQISNLPLQCPLKMNTLYYVKGFTINSKFIPSYMPESNFLSDTHLNIKDRKAFRFLIEGRLSTRFQRKYNKPNRNL
ncbi:uncharacterized protein LOC6545253 [Drosophila erecta]|uniref:Uncharacterized protein n=1 Tax=Drosophila erecta TaxID=7220 RepID=B3NDY2_DROER|nr:uncharacterized protein LOC6545253 [Drosophila erecta]EDV52336.1 uncharacterized protein Dere_GG16023 [Drosophila erecta]